MNERIGSRTRHTLEDVIKKDNQKPALEMLQGVAKARNIMQEHRLVEILGITGLDSVLFHAFIAERVIRTRLYDLEWIIHSPGFEFTPKTAAEADLMRSKLEESLDGLILERNGIAQESYADMGGRIRARNLELAANDLVARGSVFIEEEHSPHTEIIISDELSDSWAMRWWKKFVPKRGHARQNSSDTKNSG